MRSLLLRATDRLFLRSPAPAKVGWLSQWTYAHRGKHDEAIPENSLAGFRAALEAGLGIECDIQRSRDGQAMVFHDWELGRLTDGSGIFGELDSRDIETFKFRGKEYGITRLSALLKLVGGEVPILIEIKSRPDYDVTVSCAAVDAALQGYAGLVAVMSFDPRVARWYRRNAPERVAGLVMREDDKGYTQRAWQRHLALWIARPDFLAYHVDALPNALVDGARLAGLPLLTWTVDTTERVAPARLHADAAIAEAEGLAELLA